MIVVVVVAVVTGCDSLNVCTVALECVGVGVVGTFNVCTVALECVGVGVVVGGGSLNVCAVALE